MFPHLGGFESTQIFGTGQDVLGTTRHTELWREDLTRLQNAGIRALRYSIPWHSIERERGSYDWEWMDGPMRFMEEHGMHPIADPLHHTSFPQWLTEGFLNPDFPALYEAFLAVVCRRYPFIRSYTVFNEPLPTTLFCSYTGMWYPHYADDRHFVAMALQVARAICRGCETLKSLDSNLEFVHVETAEHHHAVDSVSTEWVEFANNRRFLMTDLVLGRICPGHPLYEFFTTNGALETELQWFPDHPATITVLGLDYYTHSEMAWGWARRKNRADILAAHPCPRGFASLASEYVDRYRLPIMLSETNIRGTVGERIAWLKFMEAECEGLVIGGCDFRGFCWYPSIDTTDWSTACTKVTGIIDPQGIWSLHPESLERIPTQLSDLYSELAQGRISASGIPSFEFGSAWAKRLQGYKDLSAHPLQQHSLHR